jgi:hypothetical protein
MNTQLAPPSWRRTAAVDRWLEHDGDDPGLDKYHVHVPCFSAWEFERASSGPTCDLCLMRIRVEQPVVFRDNGHLEHIECPVAICVRCLRPLQAGDSTRRIGDDVAHRMCPDPLADTDEP